jgi:hypothetical protein
MSKSKIAPVARIPQPAQKSYALTAVQVECLDAFDQGNSLAPIGAESPEFVALALDFMGRLYFRRANHEQEDWASGRRLVEYLTGLSELITYRNSDGFSQEMGTFLAESIEYAAMRAAVALDGPERRMARWRVSLGDVEAAPKAVAS